MDRSTRRKIIMTLLLDKNSIYWGGRFRAGDAHFPYSVFSHVTDEPVQMSKRLGEFEIRHTHKILSLARQFISARTGGIATHNWEVSLCGDPGPHRSPSGKKCTHGQHSEKEFFLKRSEAEMHTHTDQQKTRGETHNDIFSTTTILTL